VSNPFPFTASMFVVFEPYLIDVMIVRWLLLWRMATYVDSVCVAIYGFKLMAMMFIRRQD